MGHVGDDRLKVMDNGAWSAYVMPDQLCLGRLVVPLKRPCGSLAGLSDHEWLMHAHMVRTLEAALHHAFGATMFNWCCLMNDAYQDNCPEPQVHWHLRPRYEFPVHILGREFHDPNFGHHYLRADSDKVILPLEELEKIAQHVRRNVDVALALRTIL